MATYLDRILASHRQRLASDGRCAAAVRAEALDQPPARSFAGALRGAEGLAVIAEVKRRSPSRGDLSSALDPAAVATEYVAGGATCLSVLTDGDFFGGSESDLVAARAAVGVPVLRKDFTVGAVDVYDARRMGADAVLLIVAALSPSEVEELVGVAGEVGIDALVEVHDEAEAAVAVAAGATLVGVNQRDLVTFEVDTERAVRVASSLPGAALRVAESGVRTPGDAARLAAAGFDAVLVGESVVTSGDRAAAVRALVAGAAAPVPAP